MLFEKVECLASTYKSGGLSYKLPKMTRHIYIYKRIIYFNYLSSCKLWTQHFYKNFTIKSIWQVVNGR